MIAKVSTGPSAYLDHIVMSVKASPAGHCRILDLGGGASLRDLRILSEAGASSCVGMDIARTLDSSARSTGVEYICADVDGNFLPIANESFDLVLMNNVIEHLYYPKDVLRECWRVLRSGGTLAILTPNQARLINRFRLLFGRSVYYPLDYWLGAGPEHIEKQGKRVFAGHIREYTVGELRGMLTSAGFEIESAFFYQAPQASPRETLSKSRFLLSVYNLAERLVPESAYMISMLASKRD